MNEPELFVVITSGGTASVSTEPLEGSFPQTVVHPIRPGETVEDVPYEAWSAIIGETVDLEELQREIRRGRLPEVEAPDLLRNATCPRCGTAMVAGELFLDSTVLDQLLAGTSAQRLFFKATGDKERDEVLAFGGVTSGFRCPQCASVLVL